MDEDASPNDGPDPVRDYPSMSSLYKGEIWRGLLASEVLEAAAIRHCLAGDMVQMAQGSDTVLCFTFVAVSDEQLAEAGALLSSTGVFLDAVCTHFKSNANDDDFPGFVYVTEGMDWQKYPDRVMVVPASYLHLDLGAENYARNTVLHPEPRCRLPDKLHYADALISTVVERTRKNEDYNGSITRYLQIQLFSFLLFTPKPMVSRLPPEDLLFIELFDKVLLPSARKKLCVQWDKIRRGETTVEEARKHIPRKDLEVAALKAKYEAKRKQEAASAKDTREEGDSASVI